MFGLENRSRNIHRGTVALGLTICHIKNHLPAKKGDCFLQGDYILSPKAEITLQCPLISKQIRIFLDQVETLEGAFNDEQHVLNWRNIKAFSNRY